jgi:pSer/pThr/pTyr-binding forkhead associated (FHA) protein
MRQDEATVVEGYQVEHFLVIKDTEGKHKVPLNAAYYSLGRSPECDIVLHSSLVSRHHAYLQYIPVKPPLFQLFRIVDGNMEGLRSTNGIQINGKSYASYILIHGDEIVFSSNTTAYYRIEPEPPYRVGDFTEIIATLNELTKNYIAQNRLGEAEEFLLQVIDLKKQAKGDSTLDVAESLTDLAAVYYSQQRFNEAETIFLEALAIKRNQPDSDSLDIASSSIDLAAIYNSQNRFSDAETIFLEALKLKKKALGNDHPDVAASLVDLGAIYYSQKRLNEAKKSFRQALKIYKQKLGEGHPSTVAIRKQLSNLQAKARPKWMSVNGAILAALVILSGVILYSVFATNESNLLCIKTVDGKEQTFRGKDCQ